MKLEVGKKYVCRNTPNTKYVKVEAIREIRVEGDGQAACTIVYANGTAVPEDYSIDGKFCSYLEQSIFDLVAEYEESVILITENDVGRKVRLRNGDISMIIHFMKDSIYPIRTQIYSYTYSGQFDYNSLTKPQDIIEFVD
jgi:hypothetical protein